MSQQSDSSPLDPFGAWRNLRDANLDAWSKLMIDVVNSEAYADATARMLESTLSASAPFRQMLTTTMTQVLTQFNMPTRTDVISLAERLTNIERRLDDLEARLDRDARSVAGAGEQPDTSTEAQ